MNTAPTTRFADPAPLGKFLRAVATARASLKALVAWASREEPAAVAGPMTRAQEARATREYALRFSTTEPRFAAELCAAADRHERGESA